jgi:hypothetical protein
MRGLFIAMLALLLVIGPAAACTPGGNQPNASGAPGY